MTRDTDSAASRATAPTTRAAMRVRPDGSSSTADQLFRDSSPLGHHRLQQPGRSLHGLRGDLPDGRPQVVELGQRGAAVRAAALVARVGRGRSVGDLGEQVLDQHAQGRRPPFPEGGPDGPVLSGTGVTPIPAAGPPDRGGLGVPAPWRRSP
ncbi:MAG: hypothetical protein M3Q22_17440 [Actinomycetota bacterium]|nr:hypothetical protein [Actinomycetota bacterium]